MHLFFRGWIVWVGPWEFWEGQADLAENLRRVRSTLRIILGRVTAALKTKIVDHETIQTYVGGMSKTKVARGGEW